MKTKLHSKEVLISGNENQVTFKRGTNFRITKIKKGKRKIIYMEEI